MILKFVFFPGPNTPTPRVEHRRADAGRVIRDDRRRYVPGDGFGQWSPSTILAEIARHETPGSHFRFFSGPSPPAALVAPGKLRAGHRTGPTDVEMCFSGQIHHPPNRRMANGLGCSSFTHGRRTHPTPGPNPDFQRARPKPGVRRADAVLVVFVDMQCTRNWPPFCPVWSLVRYDYYVRDMSKQSNS